MRIMAVDCGNVRTGVAVSDTTLTLVGDAWVIHSSKLQETVQRIADEAAARDVSCIVVGYPKNMDGSAGESAIKVQRFSELLKTASGIDIILWDERLTTKDAGNILSHAGRRGHKKKRVIDAVAASLILESYLDSLRYNSNFR